MNLTIQSYYSVHTQCQPCSYWSSQRGRLVTAATKHNKSETFLTLTELCRRLRLHVVVLNRNPRPCHTERAKTSNNRLQPKNLPGTAKSWYKTAKNSTVCVGL